MVTSSSLGVSERLEVCEAESDAAGSCQAGECAALRVVIISDELRHSALAYTRWRTVALRPIF